MDTALAVILALAADTIGWCAAAVIETILSKIKPMLMKQ